MPEKLALGLDQFAGSGSKGDHVVAGQVLIDLDPTEASADLEATRTERMQALLDAEAARLLLSEAADPVIASLPEVEAGLPDATQTQARLQLSAHRADLAELEQEIADKRAALAAKAVEVGRNAELTRRRRPTATRRRRACSSAATPRS